MTTTPTARTVLAAAADRQAAEHAEHVADWLAARHITTATVSGDYAEGSRDAYLAAWQRLTGQGGYGPVLQAAAQRHGDRVLTVAEYALPAQQRMALAAMREPRP